MLMLTMMMFTTLRLAKDDTVPSSSVFVVISPSSSSTEYGIVDNDVKLPILEIALERKSHSPMVFSPAISALQSSLGAGKPFMAAQENVRVVEGVDAERSLDTCGFGWAWVEIKTSSSSSF